MKTPEVSMRNLRGTLSKTLAGKLRQLAPIGYYTGKIVVLLAGTMIVPLAASVIAREPASVLDFLTGMGLSAAAGVALLLVCDGRGRDLTWSQGMVVVASSWLIGMALAAVPFYLSGHWGSFLDAMFDVMSGFTTTGLALVRDLDHLPIGMNIWRHLLQWLGGQGIVVLALTFLVRGLPGAFRMYVGEAKDERLLPNVVSTARVIWCISVLYLLVGTIILWVAGIAAGLSPTRGLLHGFQIFMAAWSTGGFSPQSQNIAYYHSLPLEIATVVFFVIGSLNFNLHWAVLSGNRRELVRNIESVSFATTSTAFAALAMWELARLGTYTDAVSLFRRGYYTMISAHTTTGFATLYARQFVLEWGPLALIAITAAMLLGGSASSTAGGFKAVRVGIAAKAVFQEVRRLLAPERAVTVVKIHLGRDVVLEDRYIRAALTIVVLYFSSWMALSCATAAYGWDIASSMFEAASVIGNVGLSSGVTSPLMPAPLKVLYIVGMWVGRLEFMAVLVFAGYMIKGTRR